jgi:hypothetical protein
VSDLSDQIQNAAETPQSATVDGRSATARPIGEMIAADRYLREIAASTSSGLGIRMVRTRPPGAVHSRARFPGDSFGSNCR